MWTQLFSIITVICCIFVVIIKYPATTRDIKYFSLLALITWLMGDIFTNFDLPFSEVIHILLQSVSMSSLMVVFLALIRRLKPIVFRYPYPMIFIPFLIPVAHWIVMDTLVMRNIIFMTLQGVAIFVLLLLVIGYWKVMKRKIIVIIGILCLLWGFAFYWILQEFYIVFEWSWGLANSVGVIASVFSFSEFLIQKFKNQTTV